MDRLKQALEKFDLAFPIGLFRISRMGSVRLVLVRRVELDRFITQAKRASGPQILKIMVFTMPYFSPARVFVLFKSRENIVVSNVGC